MIIIKEYIMDFGRKGDAKKAMKLHWKEGITLARLGRKFWVRSLLRSLFSKKRRVQDMAKKAETTLERGITLKQAWKKVQGEVF